MSVPAGNVGFVTKDPAQPDQPDTAGTTEEPAVVEGEVVPAAPATGSLSVPVSEPVDTGYTAAGVPTFDSVREKIETRYGTAIGASELAAETPEGRSIEEQYEKRQQAAAERLQQIRESMHEHDDD
jgi:phage shock protein A